MRHALPLDVRLMNATASVLFAGCAVLLVAVLGWWAVRHPAFSIARIVVEGELVHNNAVTLRANVAPSLTGNFFTVDLAGRHCVRPLDRLRLSTPVNGRAVPAPAGSLTKIVDVVLGWETITNDAPAVLGQ